MELRLRKNLNLVSLTMQVEELDLGALRANYKVQDTQAHRLRKKGGNRNKRTNN